MQMSAAQAERLPDRFWSKVDQSNLDGCWAWTGSRSPKGYGQFMWTDRRPRRATHVACWLTAGAIPDGMRVLHRCDNPSCCNPAHFFFGTPKDNTQDMVSKGRAKGAQGIAHRSARLTEDQVRAIRAASGTQGDIAVHFGVTNSHVCNIRNRKKWKHLD